MTKITLQELEDKVVEVRYFYWDTLTICVVEVENGYKVVGTSACADPQEYNQELGMELAYKDALNKLWPLEGYLLCQDLADGAVLDELLTETDPSVQNPPDMDPPLEKQGFDWDEFPPKT